MIESEDHFTDESWADFVRDVMTPDARRPMQQHLDDRCEQCRSRHSLWSLIARAAITEPDYEPSESAVRFVENAYASRKLPEAPRGPREPARRRHAPSWSLALAADVRGAGRGPQRLVYETKDFLVDLRVSIEPDGERLVTGDIAEKTGTPGAGIRVYLVGRTRQAVESTVTDNSGGFQLEWKFNDEFKLLAETPNGKILEIVLPRATKRRTKK